MIVVKVELHSAITGQISEIGRMHITNDGSSDNVRRGNYNVSLMRRGTTDQVQRRSRVEKFPRLALSVWVLVARALKNLGIERFADFYENQVDTKLTEEGL